MRRRSITYGVVAVLVLVAPLTGGCSTMPSTTGSGTAGLQARPELPERHIVWQRESASFMVCAGSDCTAPTRKHLASAHSIEAQLRDALQREIPR